MISPDRPRMKALLVDDQHKHPRMVMGEWPVPVPGPKELLVRIEATALNRADLLQKKGGYQPPDDASPLLGLEMAGTVTDAGDEVTEFRPGDRVFGLMAGGGYAQYCTIDEGLAIPIPDSLGITEAAGIAEVYLTAWQALTWLGNLSPGEIVLIHAGASGVGTAAIQLASTVIEATVVTTAGNDEKCDLCRQLGADHAFNYRQSPFDEAFKNAYGKQRPNLILDFVGADYWARNLSLLAMDGRLVLLGLLSGISPDSTNLAHILRKRLTIRGSTLRNRPLEYKRQLVADFRSHCYPFLESGRLKPIIDSEIDWRNVEDAHQKMRENRTMGKIILVGVSD
jgi:tumor protein p53-inducible protein 3